MPDSLPSFDVRSMQVADIPAVLTIERESFPRPATEQLFVQELSGNALAHYYVLVEDSGSAEVIIGYAGYWLIAGEVHISTIAIRPDRRGRGLGEWLLQNLLRLACETSPLLITLEVRRGNLVAQNLYRKYRFEQVGIRRGYYRDTGEDALLLTVDLGDQPDYCTWLREQTHESKAARPTAD